MKTKMMFITIEVNLLFWLALGGLLSQNPSDLGFAKNCAFAGCGFAAVMQHWAYYNILKKPK